MPQRPGIAARIPEGHIPELHLILPVRPFFGGQAALVHGVGQVQKLEGQPQEYPVGPDVAQRLQRQRNAAEQLGGGPHILGHRPHIEGPGPGFQADIQIHHPGKQRRKRLGQPLQQPHPTPGQPGDGGAGGEAVLPHIAAADIFLLAVDTQIGGAGQFDGHEAKEAEIPVALPHGGGLLAQQQVGPAAKGAGCQNGGHHGGQHPRHAQRAVQHGQRAVRRHVGKEQSQGKAYPGQYLHRRLAELDITLHRAVYTIAAPVVVLLYLAVQVLHLLPVAVGIVQRGHLVHQQLVLLYGQRVFLILGPAFQQPVGQRHHRRQPYRQRCPEGQPLRIPSAGQLRDDPGGQPDGHIGGQRLPGRAQRRGNKIPRPPVHTNPPDPPVQPPGLPVSAGVFGITRHLPRLPPDNSGSAPGTGWHSRRPGPAVLHGCPARQCGRPPKTGSGHRTGWMPAGG